MINSKILFFSDCHLGMKSYSIYHSDGLTTAEKDCRNALNSIAQRVAQPDIDFAIFCGDFYHTNHPSSLNIEWTIEYLKNFPKSLYIIPGNHDIALHANSLIFSHRLDYPNISLIDTDVCSLLWNDRCISLIPFTVSQSSKDKDESTREMFFSCVREQTNPKTIFVTHLNESEASVGSEAKLISRYVSTVDMNDFSNLENSIFVFGHIHRHQLYKKKNGATIVYPGSLLYHDYSDATQKKGFITIDTEGNIEFECTPNIRKFSKYSIPDNADPLEFFNNIRIPKNNVIFCSVKNQDRVDDTELRKVLSERGSLLGHIRYESDNEDVESPQMEDTTDKTPFILFQEYTFLLLEKDEEGKKYFKDIISLGTRRIEECFQIN